MSLLFWLACVPARLTIAAVVLAIGVHAPRLLPVAAAYVALTTIGFAYHVWKRPAFGGLGGAVWWARARVVHTLLWATAAALAGARVWWAGGVLLADAGLGVVLGALHFGRGWTF